MVGLGVDVLGVGPGAYVAALEAHIPFASSRVKPERHVNALDFLDVVVRGEIVGQQRLSAVVLLQGRNGRIAVELEGDDVIGLEDVGQLAGNDGVVAAVRAAGDRCHLVDHQLSAARGAVVGPHVLDVGAAPFGLGDVVLDRVAGEGLGRLDLRRFVRRGLSGGGPCRRSICRCGDGRDELAFDFRVRLAPGEGLPIRFVGGFLLRFREMFDVYARLGCEPQRAVVSVLVVDAACDLGIGLRLLLGVEGLDFGSGELRFAELAAELSDGPIENKPAVAVWALVRSGFGHSQPPRARADSGFMIPLKCTNGRVDRKCVTASKD